LTVYALRRDGFSGKIDLALKDAPEGFKLFGGGILANQDQAKLTLAAPGNALKEPLSICVEGRATIDGREVVHPGVPAEDMMQAFIYHHLVPMKSLLAMVSERPRPLPPLKLLGDVPLRLPVGGTAAVRLSPPRGPVRDRLRFALLNPPQGISIQKVSPTDEGVTLLIHADAQTVKPGLKGNLIVEASLERPPNQPGGKGKRANKQRLPLDTVPPIAFEVVEKK
jgi:hypothetical protein